MWPYPKVVAHRGGGQLAPENTLAALQCGLDHGFHAVEFDVMLSKDGVPVLMHDPNFGRTVAGKGEVAQSLAQELLQMDAGSWFDARFTGECVPSYEAAFRFCIAHGIWMNVEIKPAPGHVVETGREVAKMSKRLLRELQPPKHLFPLFSSFEFEAVAAAKVHAPDIPRALLMDRMGDFWLGDLQKLEAKALHTNHKHLNADLARQVKQAGYGLFCYTVNTIERAKEIHHWGVDAFCTDRIDLISANAI